MRAIRLVGIAAILTSAFMLSPNAFATGSWYARFDVSYNAQADNGWGAPNGPVNTVSKRGVGADIALGRDVGAVWAGGSVRGEFELSWKYNDVDYSTQLGTRLTSNAGHTRVSALMYNLYNDFRPNALFDPYIGAGIGYADVRYHYYGYNATAGASSSLSSSDSTFAYQLLAGIKFNCSQSVAVDLGYSMFVVAQPSLSSGNSKFDTSYRSNSALLGLDWKF